MNATLTPQEKEAIKQNVKSVLEITSTEFGKVVDAQLENGKLVAKNPVEKKIERLISKQIKLMAQLESVAADDVMEKSKITAEIDTNSRILDQECTQQAEQAASSSSIKPEEKKPFISRLLGRLAGSSKGAKGRKQLKN